LAVERVNYTIKARRDLHRGLIALDFADAIELLDPHSRFDKPLKQLYFRDAFADIGQKEWNDLGIIVVRVIIINESC